jgi:hypothetical protein
MKKKIIYVLLILLSFTMCKKENIVKHNLNVKMSDVGQIALTGPEYEVLYDSVLLAAYYGLLDLSKSASFKSLVNSELSLEFDGDFNVLLKKISVNWPSLESDMTNSINSHFSNPSLLTKYVDEAVNGFEYFDLFLYPQIFVPFEDQVSLTDNPKLALNLYDSTILPGQYLNSSNVLNGLAIDEDYAEENLIWVISTNERITSEEEYSEIGELEIEPITEDSSSFDTSVISITYGEYFKKVYTQQKIYKKSRKEVTLSLISIKPYLRKENWGNGADEIAWTGLQWDNGCHLLRREEKDAVLKIKKKESKSKFYNFVSYKVVLASVSPNSSIDEYSEDENLWCLIYEIDNRKTFNKTFSPPSFDGISQSCQSTEFCSKQTPYGDMNAHWVWWNDHYFENGFDHTIVCNLNGTGTELKFLVGR